LKQLAVLIFLPAFIPGAALADGYFRCGSSLVSAEMSTDELIQKCGYPTSTQSSTTDVRNAYGAKVGKSTVEIWRYDRGPRASAMLVRVVDGKVESIQNEPASGVQESESP
jgi:Protein of unknown function (DUF2845)